MSADIDTVIDAQGPARRHGPLSGIRVLAIENYLAGNHASYLLTLFGADVVKIEQPGVGDALRGPESKVGHLDNKQQNKRSVAIDLHDARGLDVFLDLVSHADVVFSNQKPASLHRMGLTMDTLSARKQDIVYATLSGFGHDDIVPSGPFGSWPAFDVIAQGVAGLQFRCMGPSEEAPGYNGIPLGDDGTAILAAFGIVLALRERDVTGEAQRVDVAMHDAMVYLNGSSVNRWRTQSDEAPRGKSTGGSAPYGAYRSADGWVNLAVWGEKLWQRFCKAIAREDAADDPRFRSAALRLQHLGELNSEVVDPFVSAHTSAEVIEILHVEGIPVAPIFTTGQVVESPQVAARKLFTPYRRPDGTLHETLGAPIKMSCIDETVPLTTPPRLGEDTRAIVGGWLGIGEERLDALIESGVLQAAESPAVPS